MCKSEVVVWQAEKNVPTKAPPGGHCTKQRRPSKGGCITLASDSTAMVMGRLLCARHSCLHRRVTCGQGVQARGADRVTGTCMLRSRCCLPRQPELEALLLCGQGINPTHLRHLAR